MIANFVGETLFAKDTSSLEDIFEGMSVSDKNAFLKFLDGFITWLKEKLKGNLKYTKEIAKLEQMYSSLIKTAKERYDKGETPNNKKSTDTQSDGGKYSLAYTTDNKPVAIIDEDILAGVPKSDWVKTAKKIITDKFSEGIPISGRLIKVNKISKNEYINSKYSQYLKSSDGTIYADKFKAANNLDDIILATTNYINENLNHSRSDNIREFARGDVLIRVGNNDYSAKVIVGFTNSQNMVLYDVIDFEKNNLEIKKKTPRSAMQNAGSQRNEMPSTDSIPIHTENVNKKFSISSKNIDKDGTNSVDYTQGDGDNVYDGAKNVQVTSRITGERIEIGEEAETKSISESRDTFLRRMQESGNGRSGKERLHVNERGNVAYVPYNDKDSKLLSAVNECRKRRFKVTLCSGSILTNKDGITTEHFYAVTSKSTGEIYVSDLVGENIVQALDHEEIHSLFAKDDSIVQELYDVFYSELNRESDSFINISDKLLSTYSNINLALEELLCHLRQGYNYDTGLTEQRYGGAFKNWDNVARALDEFNNSLTEAEENSPAFSIPDASTRKISIDNYTEEQYNNFGWITDNNLVSSNERETLFSRYADYKHNGDKYPTTRFGEAVIHSTECPDVIMYVKGEIEEPNVTKIVRIIADDSLDISVISERIIRNEYKQKSLPYETITQMYGEEYIRIDRRRDYETFRQVKARTERERSKTVNTDSRTSQDGTGSLQQNSTTDRADGITSAFSMPKKFSIPTQAAELQDKLNKGEITPDEYREGQGKLWKEAIDIFDAMNENSELTTPQQVTDDKVISRTVDNIRNHTAMTQEMSDALVSKTLMDDFSHEIYTDKKAATKAEKIFNSGIAEDRWNKISFNLYNALDFQSLPKPFPFFSSVFL